MNTHLLMDNYDIAGGRNIGTNNDINAINSISATRKSKGYCLESTSTSTFTGNILAPNIYTKTEVNQLLSKIASSSDITSAKARKTDTSTTYSKRVLITC